MIGLPRGTAIAIRPQMPEGPVKIVLERRVHAGTISEFERWTKVFVETAAMFPGLQGSSVFNLSASCDYFILLAFTSRTDLERWQTAPQVVRLLAHADSISVAIDQNQVKTGLETWFTVPGLPAPCAAPPRWKMAVVTWLAVLPQAFALAYLIPRTLPLLVSIALSTAIPVTLLTWVVMPWLTRRLYAWLYEGPVSPRRVADRTFEAMLVDLQRSDPRL